MEAPTVKEYNAKGVDGRYIHSFSSFDQNTKFNSQLRFKIFDEMVQSDSSLERNIQAYLDHLVATDLYFESKDEAAVDFCNQKILDSNLLDFTEFLTAFFEDALVYGFSVHEYEWGLDGQKIYPAKFLYRFPGTFYDFRIEGDKIKTVQQRGFDGRTFKTIKYDFAEDNILWYAYNRKGAGVTGRPALRPQYMDFIQKRDMKTMDFIGQDKNHVGTPLVYTGGLSEEDRLDILRAAENIRTSDVSFIEIPSIPNEDGERIKYINNDTRDTRIIESIKDRSRNMAKTMLLTHYELGDMSSGSRDVAEVQEQLLFQRIRRILKQGIARFNRVIMAQMNQVNFTEPVSLKYNDPDKKTKLRLIQTIGEANKDGLLSISNEDENFIRKNLGLPVMEDSDTEGRQPKNNQKENFETKISLANGEDQEGVKNAKQRQDLKKIKRLFDEAERLLSADYDKLNRAIIENLLSQFEIAIKTRSASAFGSVRLSDQLVEEVVSTLRNRYLSSFNAGKTQAADELEMPAPTTTSIYQNILSERAIFIANAYISDMLFEAKNTASKQIGTRRTDEKITKTVREALERRGETIKGVAQGDSAREVNEGRRRTHEVVFDNGTVQGFVYSAVLDSRTTFYCRTMNGTVITAMSDYDNFPVNAHPRCRSVWVAVKTGDGKIKSTLGSSKRKQMTDELAKYDLSQNDKPQACGCETTA